MRPWRAGRPLALLTAASIVVAGCSLGGSSSSQSSSRSGTISANGGSLAAEDGKLTVSFASGQLTTDSEVTVKEGITAAPLPPAGLRPLAKPFDIAVDHATKGGTVTTNYELPAGVNPSLIVMLVNEGNAWKAVPTAVNTANHTVTGQWPHFSKGLLTYIDPLYDAGSSLAGGAVKGVKDFWGNFETGVSTVKENVSSAGKWVGDQAVSAAGGTIKSVECRPDSGIWKFTNSTGMTGCASPANSRTGMWAAKINDRYPYPLLVMLPPTVAGPGWKDMIDGTDLGTVAMSMAASHWGRVIIPHGETMTVKIGADATDQVSLEGSVDPMTTAAVIVQLAALVFTRGTSEEAITAAKAAIETEETALEAKLIAARTSGRTDYTLTDNIIDTQSDDGMLGLQRAALKNIKDPLLVSAVQKVFAMIELGNCLVHTGMNLAADGKSFKDRVSNGTEKLVNECIPTFAKKIGEALKDDTFAALTPERQAAYVTSLVLELRKQAQDVVGAALGIAANALKAVSLGAVNFADAKVVATRTGVDPTATAVGAIVQFARQTGIPVGNMSDFNKPYIQDTGKDYLIWGLGGQTEKVPVTCTPSGLITGDQAALCKSQPSFIDSLWVALRAAPGGSDNHADAVVLNGDLGQACGKQWVIQLLGRNGLGTTCPQAAPGITGGGTGNTANAQITDFVGSWRLHGAELTVNANGTGVMKNTLGIYACHTDYALTFTTSGAGLKARIDSVTIAQQPSNGGTPCDDDLRERGQVYTVTWATPGHTLTVEMPNHPSNTQPLWCGDNATQDQHLQCNG